MLIIGFFIETREIARSMLIRRINRRIHRRSYRTRLAGCELPRPLLMLFKNVPKKLGMDVEKESLFSVINARRLNTSKVDRLERHVHLQILGYRFEAFAQLVRIA